MCMNVGARTWARTGGCANWAVHGAAGQGGFCYHGTGLCQGGGSLSDRGAMVYTEAFNRVGDDYEQVCALVHTGCTRQNRFSEAPTARPTGFVVDVGGQDF